MSIVIQFYERSVFCDYQDFIIASIMTNRIFYQ